MFYWQDIRYALRSLTKNPLFTILTVVVLAGGLGLSIFTFSFLHAAMLRPLPIAGGESIVRVLPTVGGSIRGMIDAAEFALMRPNITTLSDIGVYRGRELVIGSDAATRAIGATEAEWNIFQVTGTAPLLGRGFIPDDQKVGAEPVIVLSQPTWQAVFGGDPEILNSVVRLGNTATRIIGVMPKGYGFPVASDAWLPIPENIVNSTVPDRDHIQVYARMKPGVERAHITTELTNLLQRAQTAHPTDNPAIRTPTAITIMSFPLAQIGDEAPLVLMVLNTIAFLILLLACVNVTNLLLARANEQARETAVRLALGAPRGRLIMQCMWESVLLCLFGGVLATMLAVWGLEAINSWAATRLEGNLAFWWVWGFDRTVLVAAGLFVTVAVIILGSVVARRAVNVRINAVLQEGGARGGRRSEAKVARALVIAQVSTVSLLLFFGMMSALVAQRVIDVDPGYNTTNLLASSVEPADSRYASAESRAQLYQNVYDRLADQPQIDQVVLRTPLADIGSTAGEVETRAEIVDGPRPRTHVQAALGPLSTLGIELRDGRYFDTRDNSAGSPVAIVSASFAQRHFPGRSAVGEQIRLTGLDENVSRTVVGVVSDVLLGSWFSRDRSAVAAYVPMHQADVPHATILFRHRGSEPAARAAFYESLATVDAQAVPSSISSFEEILSKSSMIARSTTTLFGACFAFALLLAVTGIYGLMSRSIGRRTRELGVRRALGATDGTILAMLLGEGGRQLGVGAVAALPLMLAIGWGFSRYFPIALSVSVATALVVSASITIIVLAATWAPTRRAIAIHPRDALWRE